MDNTKFISTEKKERDSVRTADITPVPIDTRYMNISIVKKIGPPFSQETVPNLKIFLDPHL